MKSLFKSRSRQSMIVLLGILAIASVLRVTFTSVAPLLNDIRATFNLSTSQAGMITTLPLLVFAIASPFSSKLAHRFGIERCLFLALLIICAGITLRSSGELWLLWLGTIMIGLGIAFGNVLLPSLIKRDFSGKMVHITGAYSVTMGVAAAIGSSIMVPVSSGKYGWQGALLLLTVFPVVALFVWSTQIRKKHIQVDISLSGAGGKEMLHSPLAWYVTFFLGLNSLVYYIVVSWLPSILTSNGLSPEKAGSLHGLLQLSSAIPGIFMGLILARLKDQRGIAVFVSLLCAVSIAGLWLAPSLAAFWVALYGLGGGATIILGLAFIGLRTSSAHQASVLSGMAQSFGYLLAASGPPVMGFMHDISGGWKLPLICIIMLCIVMSIAGGAAGAARKVNDRAVSRNDL